MKLLWRGSWPLGIVREWTVYPLPHSQHWKGTWSTYGCRSCPEPFALPQAGSVSAVLCPAVTWEHRGHWALPVNYWENGTTSANIYDFVIHMVVLSLSVWDITQLKLAQHSTAASLCWYWCSVDKWPILLQSACMFEREKGRKREATGATRALSHWLTTPLCLKVNLFSQIVSTLTLQSVHRAKG